MSINILYHHFLPSMFQRLSFLQISFLWDFSEPLACGAASAVVFPRTLAAACLRRHSWLLLCSEKERGQHGLAGQPGLLLHHLPISFLSSCSKISPSSHTFPYTPPLSWSDKVQEGKYPKAEEAGLVQATAACSCSSKIFTSADHRGAAGLLWDGGKGGGAAGMEGTHQPVGEILRPGDGRDVWEKWDDRLFPHQPYKGGWLAKGVAGEVKFSILMKNKDKVDQGHSRAPAVHFVWQ